MTCGHARVVRKAAAGGAQPVEVCREPGVAAAPPRRGYNFRARNRCPHPSAHGHGHAIFGDAFEMIACEIRAPGSPIQTSARDPPASRLRTTRPISEFAGLCF